MKFLKYSFIFLICIFAFSAHQAFAGSCSSNGTGTSWNTAADWTGTCTGTDANSVVGVPGTGDTVTITSGDPITLDTNTPTIAILTVNSTFDTSSSNYSVSSSAQIIVNSTGIFNANGSIITAVAAGASNPGIKVSGGTFNAGSSTVNLTNPAGGVLISIVSAGVFNAGSSTINLNDTNGASSASNMTVATGAAFNGGTSTVNLVHISKLGQNGSTGNYSFYNLNLTGNSSGNSINNISVLSGGTLHDSQTGGASFGPNTSAVSITAGSNATLIVDNGAILNVVGTTFSSSYSGFTNFTLASGSTISYTAASSTIDHTLSYGNLKTASGTNVLDGNTTATGIFTVGGTLDTTSVNNYTLSTSSVAGTGTLLGNASTISLTGTSGTLLNVTTFTAGTSTVNLTGNGSATINSGSPSFYNLTSSGTGTKTLGAGITLASGGTLSVTAGTFDPSTFAITDSGSNTLSVSNAQINVGASTFAGNYGTPTTVTLSAGSTVNYDGGTSTIDHTQSYVNLSTSGTGTYSLNGTTTATGNLTIGSGTTLDVTSSNYALNVAGSWFNSGTLTARSGTVTMNPSSSAIISGTNNFYNLTTLGTGTTSLGSAQVITNNLTIGSGTTLDITSSNYALNVGASWSNSGTFTARSGTVTFNTTATNTMSGTTTFYNLTISGNPKEVDFPAGNTTTVTNTFTANGTSGNLINLYSTSSGTQWTFAPNGTASVSYVAVRDGACAGTVSYITQSNLTNNGNNGQCWVDTTPPTVPGTPTTITTSPTTTTVLTFTWTASTDSSDGLATPSYTVQYSTDNTFTTNTQTTASTNSFTTPSLSDGTWYIRVKASDVTGNFSAYSSPSSGILIDTTAPTVPGIPSTVTVSPTSTAILTFTWTASTDSGSGLATPTYTVQYGTDPTFITAITTTSNTPSFITPTLTDGTYYLRVKASDVAGNISVYSSNSSGILIDTTAPTVPGIPTTTTPTTNTTPTFSWTASTDSGSGLAITPYTIQYSQDQTFATNVLSATSALSSFTPGTLSYGTWFIEVKAADLVGNISANSPIGSVVIYHTSSHALTQIISTSTGGGLPSGCSIGAIYSVTTGSSCSTTITPVQQVTSPVGGTLFHFIAPITKKSPKVIIIALQNLLNNDILTQLKLKLIPDGVWGNKTTLAIKAYQKVHNLYPDALIGQKTVTVFNGGAGVL